MGFSQSINWDNFPDDQQHIVHLNAGMEYGLVFGAGYGYKLETKMPIVLNLEYSFPAGKKLMDDFKAKMGAQFRLVQIGNVQFSTEIQGVFRRYQSSYVRLLNFGSDLSGVIGYYKPGWFVAGEVGFDKAIVTHFAHGENARENFPLIKGGWYQTATGGNFYYGLQTAYSLKQYDFNLKAGKLLTQDFKTSPLVPYYAFLGINRRF